MDDSVGSWKFKTVGQVLSCWNLTDLLNKREHWLCDPDTDHVGEQHRQGSALTEFTGWQWGDQTQVSFIARGC